jgi:hypothetical protein
MRLMAQLVTVVALLLMSASVNAQQPPPSVPAENLSSTQDGIAAKDNDQGLKGNDQSEGQGRSFPVSLEKIREQLAQPPPSEPLKGLNEQPTFRLEVREHQKFEQLMDKIKFDSGGPAIPGGRDTYEQQQRLFPRIDNPRLQPYGAFSTGEILTLGVEQFIEKYVAQKVSHVFGDTLRAQAEREAREEVARALAGFWAAQPATPSKN